MKKKNPVEKSRFIVEKYKEYISSSFKFGNDKLQELFEKELDKATLFKGPYVALDMPFKRGKCIDDLIEEGVVSELFHELDDIDYKRSLYLHQERAIRQIGGGRGAIVTTGTGSGKTECFLYPILNDLLFDIEKGIDDVGIRAIFLYPMNALVNDQMDRVRKILRNFSDITFGFFTGDTPQTTTASYKTQKEESEGIIIPDNELLSREEIRENPPHLLFTNYSMLEYLLIRPNDYALFEPGRLNNWKYVVLDEAHTYNGSLGIELSLLMRRLTALSSDKPRFILTSATLGEKGKSEDSIVEFAKNLTSTDFTKEDIIFSDRIELNNKNEYAVEGKDYIKLKDNLQTESAIIEVCQKYGASSQGNDVNELIYNLLSTDRHVIDLSRQLQAGAKNFNALLNSFGGELTDEELIALIDLINSSEKNGIGLFDLKYHSFVRPLSGAFVTLNEPQELSLTKTNNIGEFKAFEIANCRYCSSTFIFGKIRHSNSDNRDYLFQNKEIDIYENYGENDSASVDFFVFEDSINKDETDPESLMEHVLCAKCGNIYVKDNLNAKKCECGEEYKRSLFKVLGSKKSEEREYNNITKCPCCGRKNTAGVIKNLSMGKDEGTSFISQTLLESLEEIDEDATAEKKKISLKLSSQKKAEEKTKKAKQFLAFSDSRQQASFNAVFLNMNYKRMMRKRLIWEVIKKNDYNTMSVDQLAAELNKTIKTKELFEGEGLSSQKNAWIALLIDLLRVDGRFDGQGIGMYHFDIDLSEVMAQIDEADVEEVFGKYGITKENLDTLIQITFNIFKITPAVDFTKSTLTPEEIKEHLEYRRFDKYISFKEQKGSSEMKSFLPINSKENRIVRYVKKACNCSMDEAKEILDVLFNNIAVEGGILKKHETKDCYKIDASSYEINNYRNTQYYMCDKCGHITPYNIHDVCTEDGCAGHLVEIDPDIVLADNYYRNQYKNRTIEKIVIEEHTAQIERKKAKQYQNDFKNGRINILSCSTTFEMGVDIGDLETVFMRNIPPTPANYVQRAGRAGRRKGSSAYILTYCGTGSHDYTFFEAPEKMISGIIKPPYFNVQNKKIIIRHLMAASLGFFFRRNPKFFSSINEFVFNDGAELFEKYVSEHPNDLNEYINLRVLPESEYSEYKDFKWFDEMNHRDEKLDDFINTIKSTAKEFEEAKQRAINNGEYKDADYYSRQIEKLHKESVLDYLSKYCVIPKYGFPVDVVNLRVYDKGVPRLDIDLNRDLKIAISEYAPDSEVIADKKKYTSKYISLPKASQLTKYYFTKCNCCEKTNVNLSLRDEMKCRYCGEPLMLSSFEHYIEPKMGFMTGLNKESTRMKPKRSYSGEVSYLGGGISDQFNLKIGNSLFVETSTNEELLVMNRSEFYMCPECGYSEINKRTRVPEIKKKHKNVRQFGCTNEILQKIRLGHTFKTDVAKFYIPMLTDTDRESYYRALSFMYAFLEGISNALQIERTDIDGILEKNIKTKTFVIMIYDNVPGGAGHVKALVNKDAVINSLKVSLKKVSQECCDENTSCYNCLRNYYNQKYHSILVRGFAKETVKNVLDEVLRSSNS